MERMTKGVQNTKRGEIYSNSLAPKNTKQEEKVSELNWLQLSSTQGDANMKKQINQNGGPVVCNCWAKCISRY